MTLFELLKWKYEHRYCTLNQLRQFVELDALSTEEYKSITGEEFEQETEV